MRSLRTICEIYILYLFFFFLSLDLPCYMGSAFPSFLLPLPHHSLFLYPPSLLFEILRCYIIPCPFQSFSSFFLLSINFCVSSLIGSPIYSLISFSKPDMTELDFHFTLICLCKISLFNVFSLFSLDRLLFFSDSMVLEYFYGVFRFHCLFPYFLFCNQPTKRGSQSQAWVNWRVLTVGAIKNIRS